MTLPALREPLPVLVDEVLSLVGGLHPDLALARIAPLWDAVPDGMGKRALLSARIALMRRAMAADPAPVLEVVPAPVVEAAPVFVPAPPPKPAPVNRALTTLLSLEDAAKLLLAGGEEDAPAVPAEPAVAVSPERAGAEAELAEVIAREAAAAQRAKGKKKAKPIIPDLGAAFAEMGDASADPSAPVDVSGAFAALAEDATPPPALDLSAAFAAMEDVPMPVSVAKPKAAVIDLSATFAGMDAEVDSGGEGPAPKPKKAGKAAAGVVDLSAQFAAMQGD